MKTRFKYSACKCVLIMLCIIINMKIKAGEDTIVNIWHTKIPCKIMNVNDTLVYYMVQGEAEISNIPKLCVYKIILANGFEQTYRKVRLNAIKFHPISPAYDHVGFSYERFFANRLSYEVQFGYCNSDLNAVEGLVYTYEMYEMYVPSTVVKMGASQGFYIKPGIKIFPRKRNAGVVGQGFYFKPELAYSMFMYKNAEAIYYERPWYKPVKLKSDITYHGIAVLFNLGYQKLLANRFVLDVQGGFGYASMKINYSNPEFKKLNYYYAPQNNFHAFWVKRPGLGYSTTFKIGYLF